MAICWITRYLEEEKEDDNDKKTVAKWVDEEVHGDSPACLLMHNIALGAFSSLNQYSGAMVVVETATTAQTGFN